MSKPLIVVGVGETAELVYQEFRDRGLVQPVAFAVDLDYMPDGRTFRGLPVIPLDELPDTCTPYLYEVFVAIPSNSGRRAVFERVKAMGYHCATLIHPRVEMGAGVGVGENVWIRAFTNIDPGVQIGDNVIIWGGHDHIGHQSVIGAHSFLASGITISGFCQIGEGAYIGVGASFNDGVTIGPGCVVGNGAVVIKDLPGGGTYVGNPARLLQPKQEAREL